MSFLNSVLSSIGGEGRGTAPSVPSSAAGAPRHPKPSTNSEVLTKDKSLRRKAEDSPAAVPSKVARTEKPLPSSSKDDSRLKGSAIASSKHPKPSGPSSTSSPSSKASKPEPHSEKVVGKTSSIHAAKQAAAKLPAPTTGNKVESQVPKSRYAALLERGKANQETIKTAGQIQHQEKKKEKLSRRARKMLEAKGGTSDREGSSDVVGKNKGKTAAHSGLVDGNRAAKANVSGGGYKGTIRAPRAESTYKGTMRAVGAPARPLEKKAFLGASAKERHSSHSRHSAVDEDGEDDDMDSFISDESSDMEAGVDDIDDEEERSALTAKQEDLREQKMEAELRQKKLARLAASKRR